MLWRGTLKDFIRRNSLQPPPSADKVSWDPHLLQPRLLAQLSDKCPYQSPVPLHWAAPWGVSGWLFRCFWTVSSLSGITFISILSLFLPVHLERKPCPISAANGPSLELELITALLSLSQCNLIALSPTSSKESPSTDCVVHTELPRHD